MKRFTVQVGGTCYDMYATNIRVAISDVLKMHGHEKQPNLNIRAQQEAGNYRRVYVETYCKPRPTDSAFSRVVRIDGEDYVRNHSVVSIVQEGHFAEACVRALSDWGSEGIVAQVRGMSRNYDRVYLTHWRVAAS